MTQSFIVRLRGTSYVNSDLTERQQLIAHSRVGELLTLRAEPNNPHDRHAVAVLNSQGQQFGYLPSDARDASSILRGENVSGKVYKRLGGPRWWHALFGIKRNYGLLVELTKAPIDWKAHNQHREAALVVDALVKEAKSFEKSGASLDDVVTKYQVAMASVTGLNSQNSIAAAHRYEQAPINRVTMLLAKQKRYADMRAAYAEWSAVTDPIGLTKSDRGALEKRIARFSASGAS